MIGPTPSSEHLLDARILVVDDAPTVQHFLRLALAEAGFRNVTLAGTVAAAREALEREFDLALIDKNLEDGDGFVVAREVGERWPHTARLMMTADQSIETAIRALEFDIFAYLTKPLRRPEVLLKVRRGLDRAAMSREREQAQRDLEEANHELARRADTLQRTLDQLVATQGRLAESEKLAALGALAAGVAHEINNPACFILPNLTYLRRSSQQLAEIASRTGGSEAVDPLLEHVGRMLDRCQEGVERIQHVVSTLQIFSRRDREKPTEVDVDALCGSLLELVSHELVGVAELSTSLGARGVRVQARQQELAQALLNLLLNARRAVQSAKATRDHSIALTTTERDGRLLILVADSGDALATPDQGDHALDPFFAGSALDEGPGLGLSQARELLARNSGELKLERDDEPGRNLLQVSLPVSKASM